MKLWTFHRDGFSPAVGPVDPLRSKYAQQYSAQYQRLWSILSTDQIVWCMSDPDQWPIEAGYIKWQFDVPQDAFLAIVDEMVWNGLLEIECEAPDPIRNRLYEEAFSSLDNMDEIDEYVQAQTRQLQHPKGDPWKQLFLADPYDPRANVLLKCPINAAWQVGENLRPVRPRHESPGRSPG